MIKTEDIQSILDQTLYAADHHTGTPLRKCLAIPKHRLNTLGENGCRQCRGRRRQQQRTAYGLLGILFPFLRYTHFSTQIMH